MTNRKRASAHSTRTKLSSPGRPRAALRSQQVKFWELIKQGVSSEEAGVQSGASAPVGSRWFREAGGMPPSKFANSVTPLSGRYLSFSEREEMQSLLVSLAQGSTFCFSPVSLSGAYVGVPLRTNTCRHVHVHAPTSTCTHVHVDHAK